MLILVCGSHARARARGRPQKMNDSKTVKKFTKGKLATFWGSKIRSVKLWAPEPPPKPRKCFFTFALANFRRGDCSGHPILELGPYFSEIGGAAKKIPKIYSNEPFF